jgi:hypothetical protein
MPLTPRIEAGSATSLSDFEAAVTTESTPGVVAFEAKGRLLTSTHASPGGRTLPYRLAYRLTDAAIEIDAETATDARLVLPVVCPQDDPARRLDAHTVRIERPGGHLLVRCAPPAEFAPPPDRRVFNLVPGFQCVPLSITLPAGRTVRVTLQVERG